ncbi:MAG TPA: Rieske 2Fe-2S domain-containing protein [Cryptosporangiaceae bacterium]|nr:Rieske 2Fe-2S domain-containing protein [Cryptosporangiaceae bacterium]
MSDQPSHRTGEVELAGKHQFELVREGARRDGVEIAHYRPAFPVPGSRQEKRIERTIAAWLLLTGLSAVAFVVVYVAWPWQYEPGTGPDKLYTPLLGLTMGVALLGIGVAVVMWARRLLPEEVVVQDRHDGGSTSDEQLLTAATITNMVDEVGLKRRPLLKGALVAGLLPVGAMAVVPLGALIEDPHTGRPMFKTGWAKGVRLIRDDGTPVKPADVGPGGIITVFPGIPGGTSNEYADSPTLLLHLRPEDAAEATILPGYEDASWHTYFAYSKICTHAGCPASLYEQETKRLLCPCHQTQFDVLDACRPVFGPAVSRLPQLRITVDDDGYFVAQSDYDIPVGPGFWERPSGVRERR